MTTYVVLALLSSVTAKDLLDRSIAYHDPHGRWQRGAFEITELSSRVDGTGRQRVLRFDNARSRFEMESSIDGRALSIVVENDKGEVRLDGRADLSADELERYRLKPAQLLTMRNFYLYLWGLPMKLSDPGTRLDPQAKETHFQGRAVYELRVTYDEGVGKDTWYFYLDRETCALVGHRFHHDESAGDGEYAVLSEEVSGQGLKLPRVRQWYKNQGNELFITHTVLSILAPPGSDAGGEPAAQVRYADEEAIKRICLERIERFNRHEAPQAGAFTPDADFVNVYGMWRRGPAEIESRQKERMETVLREARITLLDLRIRFVRPDVAIVHQTHEMSGMLSPAGDKMPPHRELGIRVLVKEHGRWLTTAFHNTIVRPVEPLADTK